MYCYWNIQKMPRLMKITRVIYVPADKVAFYQKYYRLHPDCANIPEYYIVEKIVDHRLTNRRHEYLTKWSGYKELTWEPKANIIHTDAFCAFEKARKTPLHKK